jgi:hypothetical protein
MFATIYDNLFTCDMLMFITLMSSYIPLYIMLYNCLEDNNSIEDKLINKIKELQKENAELNNKLDKLTTLTEENNMKCNNCDNNKFDIDDELCHSCYHKSCEENGDKCWCENDTDEKLSLKKPDDIDINNNNNEEDVDVTENLTFGRI